MIAVTLFDWQVIIQGLNVFVNDRFHSGIYSLTVTPLALCRHKLCHKMKFMAFFKVASVVFVSKICDASDYIFVPHYMHTFLSSPRPQTTPTTTPSPPQLGSTIHPQATGSGPSASPAPLSRKVCPTEVKISWQLRPPFTLEKNESEEQPMDGIFHQALDFALGKCCEFYGGNKPIMRYKAMCNNSSALHRDIFSDESSLVFPIQDNLYIGNRRRYINILDSPGVVLIRRETSHSTDKGGQLFKAILETWPIVVLSLLMSSLAGICIWMLVGFNFQVQIIT